MPRIAGPWLAGTFDGDRAAARAASDAFSQVFPSPEKAYGLQKTFQQSILEYCREALLHETPQTLSDERTVSSDDAQATYARVLSTSISIVRSLLLNLQTEDRSKEQSLYAEIVQEPKLWAFAYHADAGVRRATNKLAQACLELQPDLLESTLKVLSKSFIYQSLNSDQTGSALELAQTLELLTSKFPSIWTSNYSGKKPAVSRLRHFLKQGSQSSPEAYWACLTRLMHGLPEEVLPSEESDIADLLSAIRAGITKRDERFNASIVWPFYFDIAGLLLAKVSESPGSSLARSHVLPVVSQYLHPTPETADWTIAGAKASAIVSRSVSVSYMDAELRQEWPVQADKLIELVKVSQPAQSKDFDKSQRNVAAAGERWADLQRELWSSTSLSRDLMLATNRKIIHECTMILDSRNGNPYGAAAIIESLFRTSSQQLLEDANISKMYRDFVENAMAKLLFTPSKRHLVQALYSTKTQGDFPEHFQQLLQSVIAANKPTEEKLEVVGTMLNSVTPAEAATVALHNADFQQFVSQNIARERDAETTRLFASIVKSNAVSDQTIDATLADLTEALGLGDGNESNLIALETLWTVNEKAVRGFMSREGTSGELLVPNVLKLEQSPDDAVAEKAAVLSSKLSSATEGASSSRFGVVLQNLQKVSAASLSMESLYQLTDRLVGPKRKIEAECEALPASDLWRTALCDAIKVPKASLALLSPLGGAVQLIQDQALPKTPQYDAEGLSQALRMSMYVTKLLTDTDLVQSLGDKTHVVFGLLLATVLVAEDNMSISGANKLWQSRDHDTEETVLDFLGEANKILKEYQDKLGQAQGHEAQDDHEQLLSVLDSLRDGQDANSSVSYYARLCCVKANDNYYETHGSKAEEVKQCEVLLREARSSKSTLATTACIAGYRQPLSGSQVLTRYCNELVADLTDLDVATNEQKGFEQLVILNTILTSQEDGVGAVAKQRRIFLIKRLLSWLTTSSSLVVQSEVCKALTAIFPAIHDMYGEHWEQAIAFLTNYWRNAAEDDAADDGEARVLMVNASLRLLNTLRKLAKSDEPNDDLVDALKEKEDRIRKGLIQLLLSAGSTNDEAHQPLLITHELLGRQLAALPYKAVKNLDDLFPLLYAPSRAVVQAAFDLLHQQIPAAQEQISFDAALDNKEAELPDELLSLLLEAPTLDSLAEASFHRAMPLTLQSYLYSWRLLFDHFDKSSYRVKGDYIQQLQDGSYLSSLLDLTFDFLGHTRGRPVDASKFDIQTYTTDTEPSPEKDVQWLLTHLYYLTLGYLPSLVKSYYLDIRSRQTSTAIDTWTAKYISPLVIRSALESVDEWSEKSVKEDPENEKMKVKVGMRSREINVSYLLDEQTMAIKIVLPEAYPLASAQVLSVNRVAVKEEKWQSWLRNCQGVITFSVSTSSFPKRTTPC